LKRILHLILILVFFTSCTNELNIQPKYSDFETDLEVKNLFGKVKEFRQFRANIIRPEENETEKPIINIKENFTKNGFVKNTEYFDTFGKSEHTTENYYDKEDYLIKSVQFNNNFPKKMIRLINRDTINKTESESLTINDTLKFKFISKFGKTDNILSRLEIEKGDTTTIFYSYKYDKRDNLIREVVNKGEDKTINEYKYDDIGNILESISQTSYFNIKTIREYDSNNRLNKITEYNTSGDLKERLIGITEYDKYYNPINEKKYKNSELDREIKNEYEFDKNGNWIKKTVSLKEHFLNSKEFVPICIESREIKYWE